MKIPKATLELIRLSGKLAGASAGAAITIHYEDPIAQFSGAVIGALFPEVINDFAERALSTREKIKVSAVIGFAAQRILANVSSRPLNIEFLQLIDESYRSSAEELCEGILLKAKTEFQEKKIKYIGALYANSIFSSGVSPEDVNHMLSAVEGWTYRKLRIIALYGKKNYIFPERNIMKDPYIWYENATFSLSTRAVLQDIFELINMGIIDRMRINLTDHLSLIPERFQLTNLGEQYFELMSLDEIPLQELEPDIVAIEFKDCYGKNYLGQVNSGLPDEQIS